jgi:hypothetical protein
MIKSTLYSWLTIPFFFFSFLRHANAYTWQFTSQPSQCQNVSIAVQGSGQPPYNLLLIPSGPTPLPNNIEVRTVQNISFTGTSTSLSFKLNYPENSSFVAVVCLFLVLITVAPPFSLAYRLPRHPQVSDSSGFGTGGTSTPVTVLQSSDSSCYNSTEGIQLPWLFYVDPTGGITQCESVRWWWNQSLVTGCVLHSSAHSSASVISTSDISRHTALSIFTASSPVEIPSTSHKALCPRPLIPAPASVGLLTSRAEPIFLLSEVMIAESVPAVMHHSRSLTQQTVPV